MTNAGQEQTGRGTNPAVAQVQLFEEAQRLLQSMRLAAVSAPVEEKDKCSKVSEIQPSKGKGRRGLLDGGRPVGRHDQVSSKVQEVLSYL